MGLVQCANCSALRTEASGLTRRAWSMVGRRSMQTSGAELPRRVAHRRALRHPLLAFGLQVDNVGFNLSRGYRVRLRQQLDQLLNEHRRKVGSSAKDNPQRNADRSAQGGDGSDSSPTVDPLMFAADCAGRAGRARLRGVDPRHSALPESAASHPGRPYSDAQDYDQHRPVHRVG